MYLATDEHVTVEHGKIFEFSIVKRKTQMKVKIFQMFAN